MNEPSSSQGGCLCGAVRYRLTGQVRDIYQCHCVDCQRASGTGSSLNMPVASDRLEVIAGEPKVFSRQVDSGRTLHRFFCADCGSPLFNRRDNMPEVTVIKVGSLDQSDDSRIIMNIWTKSARPWMCWDRTLPEHPENRPLPN
ncbi:MAG: GFA family protein [Burkholderiaceae bacterium]